MGQLLKLPFAEEPGSRVQAIKRHEAAAEKLQGQADTHRWMAAKLIAEELADGKSQRDLAAEIGKSKVHVQRMKKLWEVFGPLGDQERPPFNTAYHSAEVRGREAGELRIPSVEAMVTTFVDHPEMAELVQSALRRAAELRRKDEDSPENARARMTKAMERAVHLYSSIMQRATRFAEDYRPEDREAGEKVAAGLEAAADLIRVRMKEAEEEAAQS
jgi:hypothetical protein